MKWVFKKSVENVIINAHWITVNATMESKYIISNRKIKGFWRFNIQVKVVKHDDLWQYHCSNTSVMRASSNISHYTRDTLTSALWIHCTSKNKQHANLQKVNHIPFCPSNREIILNGDVGLENMRLSWALGRGFIFSQHPPKYKVG